MRIKLKICYDGTKYSGWQVQPSAVSVQQVVEQAIELATGEKVRVTGSGRTDAGVHAQAQVAHFDTNCTIPPQRIYRALNIHLPQDVKVLSSELAEQGFHATKSAKKKTYCYSLYLSEVENPLKERYSVMLDNRTDVNKIKDCATAFIGEHDFKAFSATGGGAKTSIRTIYNIEVKEQGQDLKIFITGNGFLYNMVRVMVGAMLGVARGEIERKDIEQMLLSGKRNFNIKTLPAKGLCLMNVDYE
jgi:tRNA pseudouridine38-40 synthase